MTGCTRHRRMTRLMTIDTRLHLHRQHRHDRILRPHVTMTGTALHPLDSMLAVLEEHKIGQPVYRRRRQDDLALHDPAMAWQARLACREACAWPGQRRLMTSCTREFRCLMSRMAEHFVHA